MYLPIFVGSRETLKAGWCQLATNSGNWQEIFFAAPVLPHRMVLRLGFEVSLQSFEWWKAPCAFNPRIKQQVPNCREIADSALKNYFSVKAMARWAPEEAAGVVIKTQLQVETLLWGTQPCSTCTEELVNPPTLVRHSWKPWPRTISFLCEQHGYEDICSVVELC